MDNLIPQLHQLRRQVRFLWMYAAAMTIVLIVMFFVCFTARNGEGRFKSISAEKIDIVEKDGAVKLSLFNQEHLPAGVINGVKLPRSGGPSSGLMFYNTEGEECGGLIYSSDVEKGHGINSQSMTFDKYKQDQVVQLVSDATLINGVPVETKGLQINDRPSFPLNITLHTIDSLQKQYGSGSAAFDSAVQKLAQANYFGATRLFAGQRNRNTGLFINDSSGAKRIAIYVDEHNQPQLVFYDGAGNVMKKFF